MTLRVVMDLALEHAKGAALGSVMVPVKGTALVDVQGLAEGTAVEVVAEIVGVIVAGLVLALAKLHV